MADDTLNAVQREAVTTTEGFVRVIAGAGSGKTRALTHRFAYLVNELGILPGNILCVTFTNQAAAEMKRRIRAMIGEEYDTALICTYHGFCARVLRERSLLCEEGEGEARYYVSDSVDSFRENARACLGAPVDGPVEWVAIDDF